VRRLLLREVLREMNSSRATSSLLPRREEVALQHDDRRGEQQIAQRLVDGERLLLPSLRRITSVCTASSLGR
jgi:hypothetical protein